MLYINFFLCFGSVGGKSGSKAMVKEGTLENE